MDTFVAVTGIEELDDALSYLRGPSAKRIGKAAAGRMATRYAKDIRRMIPGTLAASVLMATDRGIGSRNSKSRMSSVSGAKAGVGVGGTQKRVPKIINRGKRKGVGVSARNLHWFAKGTENRFTGQKKYRVRTAVAVAKGRNTQRAKWGWRVKSTGNARWFTGRIDKAIWGGFVQRGAMAAELPAIEIARQTVNSMIAAEVAAAKGGGG